MNYFCEVLTPYAGDATQANPLTNLLSEEYPAIRSWENVTGLGGNGNVPAPDIHDILIICSEADYLAIDSDPTYLIIWAEETTAQNVTEAKARQA